MYKLILILIFLYGCSTDKDIDLSRHTLEEFTLERYLGEWKEAERIDNRFERGLVGVTARYTLDKDDKIVVVNRGFDPEKNKTKEAKGYIKTTEIKGRFKVSFFRPFYGDYIVLDIDPEYKYALVGGGSSEYLWILSRDGSVPSALREKFIEKAKKLGYSYEKLKRY